MKLAIITDVHADLLALTDAIASIDRMGCDQIVCAGDLVDYGRFPGKTLSLLQERSIPTIRGNHDRWALGGKLMSGKPLSDKGVLFLLSLPLQLERLLDGVRIAVHHGQPKKDMEGVYPDQLSREEAIRLLDRADTDVLIVGHTHIPFRIEVRGRGVICNPGALLRDAVDPPHATAVFDVSTGEFVPGPSPTPGLFGVLDLPSLDFKVYAATGEEREFIRKTL